MIEEDDERERKSRWFPGFLGGMAVGILITFFVMIFFQERHYVARDEVIAHLGEEGYVVLSAREASELRGRPEHCTTSEVCSNQIEVNRRLLMRAQALEANSLRLIRERDEERAKAEGLRSRLDLEWDYEVQEDDPRLYRCRAGERDVGALHDCHADQVCDNVELMRALCAYRYASEFALPP
jgi:hypothetical protein